MAGGVDLVRSNRFCEHLHCGPMIAGCLRHQAKQIQALHMDRLAGEDLPANLLGFVDAAQPVATACLGGEAGNADARGTEGRCVLGGLAASFAGRSPFFSVHVPSTGPNCKAPPDSAPNRASWSGASTTPGRHRADRTCSQGLSGAFSSEVGTGSREENASNKNPELRSDSIGTERLWAQPGMRTGRFSMPRTKLE
jgi:hypothetical protein